tara:strand:- start:18287 stop:18796 length:510 start_codon:yes stop_codon:yes gene_type:complete
MSELHKYTWKKHVEKRGEIYTLYAKKLISHVDFVQDKISISHRGVIRGFHGDDKTYKLVTCLMGKIDFVVYDVQKNVKTSMILDADSQDQTTVLVPPKYLNAHQCLSSTCIFLYKWSEYYTSPEDQWAVQYNDKTIDHKWQLPPVCLSDRDMSSGTLLDLQSEIVGKTI